MLLPANRKSVNTRIRRVGKPKKGSCSAATQKRSAQQALINGAHQRALDLSRCVERKLILVAPHSTEAPIRVACSITTADYVPLVCINGLIHVPE